MTVDIVYIRKELIPAWRAVVEAVAAERKYLGRITLPPFDPETAFPLKLIDNDWPMYCAVTGNEVVGGHRALSQIRFYRSRPKTRLSAA